MLFAGGVACVGTGAGALFGGAESRTVVPNPALRVAIIDRLNDVSMNSTAEIVVAFESSVADPRGPNAV